jgi:hypothetical protein
MDIYRSTQTGAGGLVATRNHTVTKSGDTFTIEKPVGADTYNLEWFTVLRNWESQLVIDQTLIANDALKTAAQKEVFTAADGVKDGTTLAQADAELLVGINTTNNLITVNLDELFFGTVITTATQYQVQYTVKESGHTTSLDAASTYYKSAIPSDRIITIDTLSVDSTVQVGDVITYNIQVLNSADAALPVGGIVTKQFDVVATRIPGIIELGEEGRASTVGTSFFKFVNVGMSVTGPSNLISATGQTRAAILLANGSNSLVLQAQNTVTLDQARVRTNLGLLSTDTTLVLDTNTIDPYVDAYATDQLGFRRAALPITNQTVAGTYNLVFTVDGLTRNVSIVINNPSPKIFVLSGAHASGTVSTPVTEASGNNYSYRTSGTGSERLKFVDDSDIDMLDITHHVYEAGDKFAAAVDGVFTINIPASITHHLLYANVAVADVAVGVYTYKIVKTYPNGRVVTIEDTAAVTGIDDNGLALFDTGSALANNTKFVANWIIDEPNAEFVKGKFIYEFTFGTVNRKFEVNIVDFPKATISSVTVGSTTTTLYSLRRILPVPDGRIGATSLAVKASFTLSGLTASNFYTVTPAVTNDSTTGITLGAAGVATYTLAETAKVSLKDLTSFDLGTINDNAQIITGERVTYTIKFYEAVDYSEIIATGGLDYSATGYFVQVGEPLVIVVGFQQLS